MPSASPWWIVYVVTPHGGLAVPHIIRRPAVPPGGSKAAGGTVEWAYGPYHTKAAAQQALKSSPTGPPPSQQASHAGYQGGTWEQYFLRIGEGLLGIVLIGIAVARMTGTQNTISRAVKARIR